MCIRYLEILYGFHNAWFKRDFFALFLRDIKGIRIDDDDGLDDYLIDDDEDEDDEFDLDEDDEDEDEDDDEVESDDESKKKDEGFDL